MAQPSALTRRRVLRWCSLAVATLAGCASDPSGTATPTTDAGTDPATQETPGRSLAPETGSDGTTTPDLDLREANVVGVEVEGGDGTYRFDVTLYHDDDGEDGYANWWQVESLAGDQLGRRTLLHAHSTAPFTRSETIEVPAGTTCVVVRGHDQTHGYGGQAMLVTLESGATVPVRQGSDQQSVSGSDCP